MLRDDSFSLISYSQPITNVTDQVSFMAFTFVYSSPSSILPLNHGLWFTSLWSLVSVTQPTSVL